MSERTSVGKVLSTKFATQAEALITAFHRLHEVAWRKGTCHGSEQHFSRPAEVPS